MKQRMDVENIFKRFDADSSGSIDASEFQAMIKDLCIPLGDNELMRTMAIVDTDGNGTIEFNEFFAWYTADVSNAKASMTSDGSVSQSTMTRIKFQLQARKLWRNITGASMTLEAKNRLLGKKKKEAEKRTRVQFRKSHPCPFECEKCLNAYVFDYELTRHKKNDPNCDKITIYHKLRKEAIAKEKQEQMDRAQRQVAIDFNTKMTHLEKQEKIKERREIRLEKKDVERMKQLQELQNNN